MSKRFRKLSHTLYECKYHIIFCPKYRYRILRDEVGEYVKREIIKLLSQKEGIEIIEMNVQAEHVHLVVWIPPKYATSDVMGYLKGKLAIKVFRRFEKLRQRLLGGHLWSRGYCVSTIGIDEERIRQYVRWQEAKDRERENMQGKLFNSEEESR
jgi:putative transposase